MPKPDPPLSPIDGEEEIGVEELAVAMGLSTRTIRYYQTQGILQPPRKVGRQVKYGNSHRERLAQIADLQGRGLKIEAIKQLSLRDQTERSLVDLLGLEEALNTKWVHDEPIHFTRSELRAALGRSQNTLIDQLVEANVIVRVNKGAFSAPSRALFELSLRLLDANVSIEVTVKAAELMRRYLGEAANDLVSLFAKEAKNSFAGSGTTKEISAALEALRPIALDGARIIMAQEFERALRNRKTPKPQSERLLRRGPAQRL